MTRQATQRAEPSPRHPPKLRTRHRARQGPLTPILAGMRRDAEQAWRLRAKFPRGSPAALLCVEAKRLLADYADRIEATIEGDQP